MPFRIPSLLRRFGKSLAALALGAAGLAGPALAGPDPVGTAVMQPGSTAVALVAHSGGTFYLEVESGGVTADFLLDTGAGMVTLSESLFRAMRKNTAMKPIRQMGARLANNKIRLIDVYEVEQFAIGGCEIGPVEVAVMEGGSRNLLGFSALGLASPFSIQTSPPALTLSHCRDVPARVPAQATAQAPEEPALAGI